MPKYIQGKSLLNLFKNDKLKIHPYVYSSAKGWFSIRDGRWKLIHSDISYELYDLINDPNEEHNLIEKEKTKFKELKEALENYEKEYDIFKEKEKETLTKEEEEILRSLGYLQ